MYIDNGYNGEHDEKLMNSWIWDGLWYFFLAYVYNKPNLPTPMISQLPGRSDAQADKMMTMCHCDPKGANIMYDETEGVSFYDFQWFGKAPASKERRIERRIAQM